MLNMKCFQAAAVVFAVLGAAFVGPQAQAGHGSRDRSCDRGSYSRVSASYSGDHYRVSVSVGSSSNCYSTSNVSYRYDSGYRDSYRYESRHDDRYRGSSCNTTTVRYVEVQQPSGYWSSVYRPAVYETRYDHCGRPYRVCVADGYYERVWVSTSNCRY